MFLQKHFVVNHNMNIIISCISEAFGGKELVAYRDALWFAEQGYNIQFLVHPNGVLIKKLKQKNIQTNSIIFGNYLDVLGAVKLYRIIKNFNTDVFHTHETRSFGTVSLATVFLRKLRVFVTSHIHNEKPKKDIYHYLVTRRFNGFFAISNFMKKNALQTYPFLNKKISVIYNGIDPEQFKQSIEEREETRLLLDLKEDNIVIGILGRIDEAKGHFELVKAFANLSKKYNNIKLLIVGEETIGGDNGFFIKIKNEIKNQNISDKVIFRGFSKFPQKELNAMDIFVMPSWKEAFGMVAAEAMMTKTATVLSNNGSALEISNNKKVAVTFKAKNISSLEDSLNYLIKDDEERNRMAEKGFSYVKKIFSKQEHIKLTLNKYKQL